ncbi:MAG: hypothetical protein VX148_13400, partial [Pseudomonadota bacterium]|nr:hypothetical protein [Pseudomonadota bacterium]
MSSYCEVMPSSSGTVDVLSKSKRRFTSESNQSTSLSRFCSFVVSVSTLFIAATGSAYGTDYNNKSYEKIIEKSESYKDVVNDIKANNKEERASKHTLSFFERSAELQKAMGFKTSHWATILRVERKTIYNWKSSPDTEVQNRTKQRLNMLEDFFNAINKNHAQ